MHCFRSAGSYRPKARTTLASAGPLGWVIRADAFLVAEALILRVECVRE